MEQPYPSTATDLELPKEETLTNTAADEVNVLLEQNRGNCVRIAEQRKAQERKIEAAKLEIASLDRILSLLDKSAGQFLEQLNQPPAVLPGRVEDDKPAVTTAEHRSVWDGADPPETGMFTTVPPDEFRNTDKNLQVFGEAHDAQDAREGVAR